MQRQQRQPIRIGLLVHDVSRLRRTIFDKTLKPLGITRAQWWVLANLSEHPARRIVQTELAQMLDLGKVTLGGLIERLEARNYVVREGVPNDRRAKFVVLTPAGLELLAECERLGAVVNREIMRDLDAREIQCAEDVLHLMKQHLIELNVASWHVRD